MNSRLFKRSGGVFLAIVMAVTLIGAAAAAPGDLDPSFGTGGTVTTRFNTGGIVYANFDDNGAWGNSVARLSDGKYLVAGDAYIYTDESHSTSDLNIALARFNADGSPDETFGPQGEVNINLSGYDSGNKMLVQPDGKILVVGTVDDAGGRDMMVARFNSDGSLDDTFGGGSGWTRVDFTAAGDDDDHGYALALQSDGKIVAVGKTRASGTNDFYFAVARFTAAGVLDTDFGAGGKVTTGFGLYFGSAAYAVAIQGDGKIVVAGTSATGSQVFDMAVARYTSAGALDTSFNSNGKLLIEFGANNSEAYAVGIQADGQILVSGYASNGTDKDLALLRFNSSDGSPDTSFGTAGIMTQDFGVTDYKFESAKALIFQGDKILVAGVMEDTWGSYNKVLVARFTSSGALDTTFGGGSGFSSPENVIGNAVILDGDQILVGGTDYYPSAMFLMRLNNDGIPDTDFGANGESGYSQARAEAVAVQPDGKIVAAGHRADIYYTSDLTLARYNPDGTLDTTFSADGKVVTSFGPNYDEAYALAIQPDGKIIVSGNTADPVDACALARYNSDGSLDTSFGTGGMLRSDFAYDCSGETLALQPDGKIILTGRLTIGKSYPTFAVARFKSDGSPDDTFGGDGAVVVDFGSYSRPTGLDIQADGKIILAGYVADESWNYDFVLARLNSDGSLDTSFESDGLLISPFDMGSEAGGVAVQSNGKIIVAGTYHNTSGDDLFATRFNSDGSLDTTFNGSGKNIIDNGEDEFLYSISLQMDGKIVLAGGTYLDETDQFSVARLNANGTTDTTFSTDGMLAIPILEEATARSVAVNPDGRIILAGHAEASGSGDNFFALVQVEGDPVYRTYIPVVSR